MEHSKHICSYWKLLKKTFEKKKDANAFKCKRV